MFGFALVVAMETPTAGQPGNRALHDPPVPTQSLGGLASFAGDAMTDGRRAWLSWRLAAEIPIDEPAERSYPRQTEPGGVWSQLIGAADLAACSIFAQ
ncbi:hypothetical protein GCM10010255_66570 [Streptomyces coeruleofuscus]|uniref:Uncharacterized protein n=1 Tax=Streptomyces coeruleofuscus TaxID=66879 RepID=A0ABN3J0N6_9ACTN